MNKIIAAEESNLPYKTSPIKVMSTHGNMVHVTYFEVILDRVERRASDLDRPMLANGLCLKATPPEAEGVPQIDWDRFNEHTQNLIEWDKRYRSFTISEDLIKIISELHDRGMIEIVH